MRLTILTLFAVLCCQSAEAQDLPVARGAAFIGAMHPSFPEDRAVELLSAAAPHPALAIGHRFFGNDYVRINRMIESLLTHERSPSQHVTLVVYLDCGPCRPPRRPAGLFDLLLPGLDIPSLDRALSSRSASALQAFGDEARSLAASMPEQPGVSVIVVPVLEDGLEEDAFDVAASVIAEAFVGRSDFSIGRNRVDNAETPGYRREVHELQLAPGLKPGDIATADGQNICTRFDRNCNGLSLAHAKNLIRSGESNGAIVMAWRPEWQGLPSGIGNNPVAIPASQRTMTIPYLNCFKNLLRRP